MDNQHRKITGYRELNQEEIDLMNEVKKHGEKTRELLARIGTINIVPPEHSELSVDKRIERDEALNNAAQYLQTGQMWLVRAVALPDSF